MLMYVAGTGGIVVGIVIFALVAVFLGLRLYAVLGKRTGHEEPFMRVVEDVVRPLRPAVADTGREAPAADPVEAVDPDVESGLRAISVADRNFNAADFIDGAKSAYRMILEAYWAGKPDDFAAFVAEDVRTAFADAIDERTTAGHILDNRLITIERTTIVKASVEAGIAHVTVRFDADIAAVTRDTEGGVIAGSLSDAVPTHDNWTFSRDVKSANPNWVLSDTDEAE